MKRIRNRMRQAKRIAMGLPLLGVVSLCMIAATLLQDYSEEQPLDRL